MLSCKSEAISNRNGRSWRRNGRKEMLEMKENKHFLHLIKLFWSEVIAEKCYKCLPMLCDVCKVKHTLCCVFSNKTTACVVVMASILKRKSYPNWWKEVWTKAILPSNQPLFACKTKIA